jgi:toxin ParE1/3/4
MGVLFTPLAQTDLEEIGDYIAQCQPKPSADIHPGNSFAVPNDWLIPFGVSCAPGAWRGHSFLPCPFGNYVILYRPQAPDVHVIRVLHGAMDLPRHMGQEDL